jgi:hypothetical protein
LDLNIKNKLGVAAGGAKGIEFPQDNCKDPLGRRITEPDEIGAVVLFQHPGIPPEGGLPYRPLLKSEHFTC